MGKVIKPQTMCFFQFVRNEMDSSKERKRINILKWKERKKKQNKPTKTPQTPQEIKNAFFMQDTDYKKSIKQNYKIFIFS